jgi:membrane protease YdiL (CAAX protease family)
MKLLAVLEVIVVTFAVVPLLTLGIYRLFPGFETWQTQVVGFPFAVFVYVVMAALALLMILLRRRSLHEYGITFENLKYHLDIAGACFIPVVLASMPFGLGVDHKSWSGAVLLAAVNAALLFALALILRKKPSPASLGMAISAIILMPGLNQASGSLVGKATILFLTYALFVGFGEEILYRGYMHSRLNEAFGKPYQFFGVPFGWGGIITALLFGLTHVGILRWILGLSSEVTWAWGLWTIFSGLVFGYVREKSGSILAPALLHGLPQAIASAAMLFL